VQRLRNALVWTNIAIGIALLLILAAGGAMTAYAKMYDGRIFPGVRVLGVSLDGKTPAEARKLVDTAIDTALNKGLKFRYHEKDVTLNVSGASTNPDAARDLIRYSVDGALKRAYEMGRHWDWQGNAMEQVRLRIVAVEIPAEVIVDRAAIANALASSLNADLHDAVNARLELTPGKNPDIRIKSEEKGIVLVTDPALDELMKQAKKLSFAPLDLSDRIVEPTVTVKDLEPIVPLAHAYLDRPQLVFTYEAAKYSVPASMLAGWITATGSPLTITIDPDAFSRDIKTLAVGVEQEGKNGSLIVKDGKIVSFVPGTEGREIDAQTTLSDVLANWPATSTFPLVVNKKPGSLEGADPERLGIKELLGIGTSNFSGSPVNRRKNIAHGVELVNGTVVQPGETFSLLKTLGPVDDEHHWLPELVIKGNETKPEFGGGLCQIGTTTFRAALASGLPIVERQNHSYRVRYYEPAGTDATIYDPKPDFRFLNDTATPVLINAYLKGDNAYFEFWGTRDGRSPSFVGTTEVKSVAALKPKISNIVQPPPMKIIETLELPVGQQKCTEIAHPGADAEFTYLVTYPTGDVKKQVFQSHYRPWQAVCQVGVDHLSNPADATSTSPAI
jgi:vancomycin resistance protein YoaR